MGLVPRSAARAAAALAACALLAGCGGSVADADADAPTQQAPPPAAPFCGAAQADAEALRPLSALFSRGGTPPADLPARVDAVRRAGAELVSTAPTDIRADVERTVQGVDLQLDALVARGGDAAAVSADPAIAAQLNAPELAEAGRRVNAYIARTCGPTG